MVSSATDPPPTPPILPRLVPAPTARISDPHDTHQTMVEPVATAADPNPDLESDRFQIRRLYARGGQGHVFVARDEQLGRDVALKELQPQFADRPLSRTRFLREAEITGSLEHPGVVPVYALGRHTGGRPYYAMRLIQGRTLQQVIQEYHDPNSGISEAERNVCFRQLLQRFISVCQTIAYAHSRGIVHRDLKPSNVLIGSYGEAIVVDWGLARPFNLTTGCAYEAPTLDTTVVESPGQTLSPDSTLMGSAVGTPAFMSPEQAEGRWDLVGPASDVYALGASLYVLLTGKMPFGQLGWPEIAHKIRLGEFPRPTQSHAAVARPMEAICLKAMSLDASARYPTALALAADVEHWLADEPVSAYRESIVERGRRWARHHRTLVGTVGALWMTAAVGLAVGLVAVNREQQRTEIARQRTRTALDRQTSQVIDQWLSQQTELTAEHRDFLRKTLADYEQFAADESQDTSDSEGVVRAYRRVGEIQLLLGNLDEAQATYQHVLPRAIQFVSTHPDAFEVRQELATIYAGLGRVDRKLGRADKAVQSFGESLKLRQQLSAERQNDSELRRDLASGYSNYGTALADQKKMAEAIVAFQEMQKLRQQLVDANSTSDEAQHELADAFVNIGFASLEMNNIGEAEKAYRSALAIDAELVRRHPSKMSYREAYGEACRKLAVILTRHKTPNERRVHEPEARSLLATAANQYEHLAQWAQNVPGHGRELMGILNLIALFELRAKNVDAALAQYDRALAFLATDKLDRTKDIRFQTVLKSSYQGRAKVLEELGRFAEAASAWNNVIELDPANRAIWRTLRAMANLRSGDLVAALAEIRDISGDDDPSGEAAFNCACVLAQAVLKDPGNATVLQLQAIEHLRQAASKQYLKHQKAKGGKPLADKDLDPIRNHESFRQFAADNDR